MKIYINGGLFGSNIPLQGGTGTYNNAYLTAVTTTGKYLCTIATDYTISGKTNYGGTFSENYDPTILLPEGTFNLVLGGEDGIGDVLASNVDANEFTDQIEVGNEDCIVYVPGYLELKPYSSFVANQTDPLKLTVIQVEQLQDLPFLFLDKNQEMLERH